MTISKNKKKYSTVSTRQNPRGISIFLDDKPLKTPEGRYVTVPYKKLGTGIKKEWSDQVNTIKPLKMPLTRFSFTTIDKVSPNQSQIAKQTANFGSNDLLCYRASAPNDLIELQQKRWQPHLDWLEITHDAKLLTTRGIIQVEQPSKSLNRITKLIFQYNAFFLAGLIELSKICGSLVLGLRVLNGDINLQTAFRDSRLDERWQRKLWGDDQDSLERDRNIFNEMKEIQRFLNSLRN